MQNTFTKTVALLSLLSTPALAQTTLNTRHYVTEVITDYGGFWQSGTGAAGNAATSAIIPDNSHALLAFVVNSGTVTVRGTTTALTRKYFATGVNNALLDQRGIAYQKTKFEALALASYSSAPNSNTKISLGQLYDNQDNGASSPPPPGTYAPYLTDGTQGLNLGTGVANLPSGLLTFTVNAVAPEAIGDGVPDVLITQIASPGTGADVYRLLDATGAVVAGTTTVSATVGDAPVIGSWVADFYEAQNGAMTLSSGFTKTQRQLRLLAVDFSEFGVTASNYSAIKQLQISLSGESDYAFVGTNTNAANIGPLPVQLTRFEGQAQGNRVLLSWETASELNSAWFGVESSPDGQAWSPVGRVAAAGSTTQARRYAFAHQPARAGLGYYRLHQVDTDGTSTYSGTVVVRTGAAAVQVFPNPTAGDLSVQLPAAAHATLTLLAPDGRQLWQQQLADAPAQQVSVPLAALPAGLYLLRAELDGQAVLRRVVKE